MAPVHLHSWHHRARWFGLAIAGTLIPFAVFALTSEPRATVDPASTPTRHPIPHTHPSARAAHSVSTTLPTTPRSPLGRLKNALVQTFRPETTESVPTATSPQATVPVQTTSVPQRPPSGQNPVKSLGKPPGSGSRAASSASMSPPTITQSNANSTARPAVPLTLEDAIALTVLHNTDVQNAYLDRLVDRAQLRAEQAELEPQLTPSLITTLGPDDTLTASQGDSTLQARVSWFAPTGGTVAVDWRTRLNSFAEAGDRNVTLSFTQPLLRHGESTQARIDHKKALIQEDINLLALRSTLTAEVINTIERYRQLLLAQERVVQTQASLENAQAALQRQQALVEAGREARSSLLRVEQNVADFRSRLLAAQNQVKSDQLNLMNQLGSDRDLNVVAVMAETAFDDATLTLDLPRLEQTSLAQRPDYLQRLLRLKIAEIDHKDATNDRRWNLDLATEYQRSNQSAADWSATLTLQRDLGGRRRVAAAIKSAEVELLKQQNDLAQAAATIRIEVQNQVRAVRLAYQQLELAQEQVRLAEAELDAQEARLRAERGSNFELQAAQRALLETRNQELDERIAYLNALTELERIQGITLERWGVVLEPQD